MTYKPQHYSKQDVAHFFVSPWSYSEVLGRMKPFAEQNSVLGEMEILYKIYETSTFLSRSGSVNSDF